MREPVVKPAAPLSVAEAIGSKVAISKNPHHRFNKTINIQTTSGDVITIHPVLIEEFNGQRVVL